MLRDAGEHSHLAGAAGALPAGGEHVGSGPVDCIQNALVLTDRHHCSQTAKHDLERSIGLVLDIPRVESLDDEPVDRIVPSCAVLQ